MADGVGVKKTSRNLRVIVQPPGVLEPVAPSFLPAPVVIEWRKRTRVVDWQEVSASLKGHGAREAGAVDTPRREEGRRQQGRSFVLTGCMREIALHPTESTSSMRIRY